MGERLVSGDTSSTMQSSDTSSTFKPSIHSQVFRDRVSSSQIIEPIGADAIRRAQRHGDFYNLARPDGK